MLGNIMKLGAFPLGSVVPTDPYSKNAVEKETEYLKSFDVDRVLAGFRLNAGIKTDAAPYGGWESLLIGGHAMGHYFTALAQASVNRAIPENDRAVLREMLEKIISGLKEAQLPNGFLWGAKILDPENVEAQFDNVEKGKADLFKESWVPWYTMHKILSGLISAYSVAGIDEALEIAKKLGVWVYERALKWDRATRDTVLSIEYGGMNDVLYELYDITGDDRFAAAAHGFDEEALFSDILTKKENLLGGRHANTTIPKIIGMLKRYTLCNGKTITAPVIGSGSKAVTETIEASGYLNVAKIFWNNVMAHHTYHTGGNSEWEHFREDDKLDKNRTNANCETCNVYNMLKLTKELFMATGERKYADYLENAYINHILASQNPDTGMTTYFQAMATGYFKVYSSPWDDFWCCTGSGMENFTKLGELYVFGDKSSLTVVSCLPFELKADGVSAVMTGDATRDGSSVLKITEGEKIKVRVRIPDWAQGEPEILLNGCPAGALVRGGFCELEKPVSKGDSIEIRLRAIMRVLTLPDSENVAALKYGAYLLAAKLGDEDMTTYRGGVAVAFAEKSTSDGVLKLGTTLEELKRRPENFIKPTDKELCFTCGGMEFVPYYMIKDRYGIYWRVE